MSPRGGYSLVELLLALVVVGVTGLMALEWLDRSKKTESRVSGRAVLDMDIPQFMRQVTRVGCFASSCQKVITAPTDESIALQCVVSRELGTDTTVRFIKTASEDVLRYQEQVGGYWKDIGIYGGPDTYRVTNFILCDTTEMQTVSPTCPLEPAKLSSVQSSIISPLDMTLRFWRFAIEVQLRSDRTDLGAAPDDKLPILKFQNAFFQRSPTMDDVHYAWSGN